PRLGGPEPGHRAAELDPHDGGAPGTREDGGAVHVSVRGPQRRDVRERPRPVGAVARLVRRLRGEREAGNPDVHAVSQRGVVAARGGPSPSVGAPMMLSVRAVILLAAVATAMPVGAQV